MMENHSCLQKQKTTPIDDYSGWEIQHCYGINPMFFEITTRGQNGIEDFIDEIFAYKVNFCPYCGLSSQPERSKREDSQVCEMRCSEHCGNTVRDK